MVVVPSARHAADHEILGAGVARVVEVDASTPQSGRPNSVNAVALLDHRPHRLKTTNVDVDGALPKVAATGTWRLHVTEPGQQRASHDKRGTLTRSQGSLESVSDEALGVDGHAMRPGLPRHNRPETLEQRCLSPDRLDRGHVLQYDRLGGE